MEALGRHMQAYHGAKGVDQVLFRVRHLPLDHGTDGGHVEEGLNWVNMLVIEFHTLGNQLKVRPMEWLVLVRGVGTPRFGGVAWMCSIVVP